jgi:hypothetical protein
VEALIESVRDVQPEGPYLLGGYCYGGIVAKLQGNWRFKANGLKLSSSLIASRQYGPFFAESGD